MKVVDFEKAERQIKNEAVKAFVEMGYSQAIELRITMKCGERTGQSKAGCAARILPLTFSRSPMAAFTL
jgi:hypothetical protein